MIIFKVLLLSLKVLSIKLKDIIMSIADLNYVKYVLNTNSILTIISKKLFFLDLFVRFSLITYNFMPFEL